MALLLQKIIGITRDVQQRTTKVHITVHYKEVFLILTCITSIHTSQQIRDVAIPHALNIIPIPIPCI